MHEHDPNHIIDLRSDTVTKPTPAMVKAMSSAVVGDDVYGEDPTVNRLEEISAAKMGKEAALFVPSGTMANLIACLVHCNRGEEIIMGEAAHTFLFEAGGVSALGGMMVHTVKNQEDGSMRLADIRSAIRPDDDHQPRTRLILLENTHNRCGGVYLTPGYTDQVGALAKTHGLAFHIDGARIFNAAVAQGVDVRHLVDRSDSVTFCLSKGLCAPVGSVLCGSRSFIAEARRARKQLGGGMRQAGVIAAAGIVALQEMVDRLADDHIRAQRLAAGLQTDKRIFASYKPNATNMVFLSISDDYPITAVELVARLKERNILVGDVAEKSIRMVTHYWIDDMDIDQTVQAIHEIIAAC
ncbi:MAG: low-specificity L-threonine aldolase [Anaerolineae bacterium]|nr:low-specificity L-threonine aldolase [Anaerolineae bacterium]